jgi:cation:H+ antiporter
MGIPSEALIWLNFLACMAIIGFGGVKLAVYGDTIADKTGLGGGWVGFMLMAPVASLPELVSGVSAVTVADSPNIAVGNILGSCIFNLVILFILDLCYRRQPLYLKASQGNILTAGLTLVMFGIMGFNVMLAIMGNPLALGQIGAYTPLILLCYLISMRTVYTYERQEVQSYSEHEPDRYPGVSLFATIVRYAAAALVVVAGSLWLPFVAKDLAAAMGWKESFVGTFFVALITCIPELVLSVSAMRLGEVGMAFGSLFGSNLFNVLILAVDDIVYAKAPLLYDVSTVHIFSLFTVMGMTALAIVGMVYRPRRRLFNLVGANSAFLLFAYLVNTWVIYYYDRDMLPIEQAQLHEEARHARHQSKPEPQRLTKYDLTSKQESF